MSESKKAYLPNLQSVAKIDGALALLLADRKRIEGDLENRRAAIKKRELENAARDKVLGEKKARYDKEDKSLNDEREKLVLRRKALTTLNNYKLQQAAEKEIEHAARHLTGRETIILQLMEDVERLTKESEEGARVLAQMKGDFTTAEKEAHETLVSFEERVGVHQLKRGEITVLIEPSVLTLYNRIRDRYAMDPVVLVKDGVCGGCFQQQGPQIRVQISRGDAIVRCAGCGRILYMDEGKDESKEE